MRKIPDIVLEQYVLGELSSEKMREMKSLIDSDVSLRNRIKLIEKSNNNFLNKYPFSKTCIPSIISAGRKKRSDSRFRKMFIVPSAALALAACTLIFIKVSPFFDSIDNSVIIKGNAENLFLYRKNGNQADMLKNGDAAKKNDILQIAYQIPQERNCIIFSIDGNSNVTLHYSSSKSTIQEGGKNGKIFVPESYQLDDAPYFERFFMITSDKKIYDDDILSRAEKFALDRDKAVSESFPVGSSFSQQSVLIVKVK
ncbi:MAG TPA: hypothetical protein PLE16_13420 [Spirochaetota bacterium]|jgi:hypothetical protein|nr:hypothetical protein [Spirochaetota bacterium]HPJ16224.1 hypothetical protein [Spirochaetota bacterium]HPM35584.1 hypothetical protein [Spirochaetota bacterium]HPY03951.1 hypothetical protein [Spirochaetota bacterium]HQA53672.1 hypothetical protein [Spirochaetota bacterium]